VEEEEEEEEHDCSKEKYCSFGEQMIEG